MYFCVYFCVSLDQFTCGCCVACFRYVTFLQNQAKRSAGKNVAEMTYSVSSLT